ncbi:MAG: hypothetical protein LBP22_02790 [Deltaproteobacteria bacterium]|jgi:hypothetical protein|nr:hypothetical protein [Deltaproteobacteria bacterium]
MAENVSEITVEYEEEGETLVKELDKEILTKGPWSTILFRYQERNRRTSEFGPPKATLRRYQKSKGSYRKRDSVNLTLDSARQLIIILNSWIDQGLLGEQTSQIDDDLPY